MRRPPGWMYESYDEDGPLWTPDEMRQALLTVFAGQPSARKLADDFAELDPQSPAGAWDEMMLLAVAWTFPERAACPESVAAQVVSAFGGGAPEFRWSPSCRISYLLVSGADQDRVLRMVEAAEQGFLPGVRYGTLPAGATENVPAAVLVAGGEYYLTLGTLIGGDGIMIHATSLFTR